MRVGVLKLCHAVGNSTCTHCKSTRVERATCTCMGETAAAGAVLTGIPLRGLLGTLWTAMFCPVLPARKKHGTICISNPLSLSCQNRESLVWCYSSDNIYVPITDRKYLWRSKKQHKMAENYLLTTRKFFTPKHSIQIPEHPKSNDFISDFTVAADSDGVGDALLMQTPCQRLVVSASRESTSSAVSLQSRNQIKVRGHGKCK